MPATPLLGLSVMIHLGVILVSRLFRVNVNGLRKPIAKKTPAAIKRLSLAIIGLVFTLIALNATILTGAAVKEKHSSINFIENIVSESGQYSNNPGADNTIDINYSTINYAI